MPIPRNHILISAAKALGIFLVLATVAGIIPEQIGEGKNRKHYPQVGWFADIGGRSLNIY
jgi:hypothetical protein